MTAQQRFPSMSWNSLFVRITALKRAGINTIADLLDKTIDDLGKVRNLGKKSIDEIEENSIIIQVVFNLNKRRIRRKTNVQKIRPRQLRS